MISLRLNFKKGSEVKYISHLDLNRAMIRATNRVSLPIWFTEGFNPHPYLVFGQPLSVGFTGENEIMDLRLTKEMPLDKIKDDMNKALPAGLRINEVYESINPLKNIKFAEYELYAEFIQENTEAILNNFMGMDSVSVTKQSKKTTKQVELAPYLKKAIYEINKNSLKMTVILPCTQEDNINPSLIITALDELFALKCDYVAYNRKGFFNNDMTAFR